MKHPLLYQINTRVFLQERGVALGRPATLEDIPDAFLDDIAAKGFAWVWFLGVWQTGPVGRQISLSNPKLVEECRRDLPDLRDQDVSGSPFAITAYRVHDDFGGDAALARLRTRLTRRGLKLLLDFVPNHTAPRPPVGHEPPGVLRARQRGGSGGARPRTTRASSRRARRTGADPRVRPRSVLRRLAGHVPAQLPSRRLPRGADRRAGRDREPLRRRPLRHGDAAATADHPAHLGRPGAARPTARRRRTLRSGPRRSPPSGGGTRSSCSSPRSTGTWSGSCNRRASTSPTTSASTTG